jgi:hypothetical protein
MKKRGTHIARLSMATTAENSMACSFRRERFSIIAETAVKIAAINA